MNEAKSKIGRPVTLVKSKYRSAIDISGMTFSRLTVMGFSRRGSGGLIWLCRCSCGNEKEVSSSNLRSGQIKSCGCLKKELMKSIMAERALIHGYAKQGKKTPEFKIWLKMRARCNNPRHRQYGDYGGRGIRVCGRWDNFVKFIEDVGERPSPKHSIDRYPDNDGNYEPGNVRWATKTEQNNNRRSNKLLSFDGRTQTMAQWAREVGARYDLFRRMIQSGHPMEKAMERFS